MFKLKVKITALLFLMLFAVGKEAFADEYEVHAVVISDEFTGRFLSPMGICYDDSKERLYVTDSGNGRLISFDKNLQYLNQWSNGALLNPVSLVKNSLGKFYALDSGDHKVKYLDPGINEVRVLDFKDVPKGGSIFIPGKISLGSDDSLYIIDKLNKRVVVLDKDEKFKKELTVNGKDFYGFSDISVTHSGNVVAIDTIGRYGYIIGSDGKLMKKFGGPAFVKGGGSLYFPVSVYVHEDKKKDDQGNVLEVSDLKIYILDSHRGRVNVYNEKGSFNFSLAGRGFEKGHLHDPVQILVDEKQRVYTLESARVQILKRVNE